MTSPTLVQDGFSESLDISMTEGDHTNIDFRSTGNLKFQVFPAASGLFYAPQASPWKDGNFESSAVDPELVRDPSVRDEALSDLRGVDMSSAASMSERPPGMEDFLANLFPVHLHHFVLSSVAIPTDISQTPTSFDSSFFHDPSPRSSYDPGLMHNPTRHEPPFDLPGKVIYAAHLLLGGFRGFNDFLGDIVTVTDAPADHFDIGQFVHLDRFY
jgi:hypothetical protein